MALPDYGAAPRRAAATPRPPLPPRPPRLLQRCAAAPPPPPPRLCTLQVLKLLARSLHVKQAALRGVLRALPTLFAPSALEQVLQAACAPEGSHTEAASAVEALLRPPLERMGQSGGVLPQLVDAATRLIAALELGSKRVAGTKGEAEGGSV